MQSSSEQPLVGEECYVTTLNGCEGDYRTYCLYNYICKWLDFLVFSGKDDKTVGPVLQLFIVHNSAGRKKT